MAWQAEGCALPLSHLAELQGCCSAALRGVGESGDAKASCRACRAARVRPGNSTHTEIAWGT